MSRGSGRRAAADEVAQHGLRREICRSSSPPIPVRNVPPDGKPDQGSVEVRVERPEQAVTREHVVRDLADDVELVVVLETNPLVEPEVLHDTLLPFRLVRGARPPERRSSQGSAAVALAPRDVGREREHRRRVAAAGEAHEAGWAGDSGSTAARAQRARHQGPPRQASPDVRERAEDESGSDLERRQPCRRASARSAGASARRTTRRHRPARPRARRAPRSRSSALDRDDHVSILPVRRLPPLEHERALETGALRPAQHRQDPASGAGGSGGGAAEARTPGRSTSDRPGRSEVPGVHQAARSDAGSSFRRIISGAGLGARGSRRTPPRRPPLALDRFHSAPRARRRAQRAWRPRRGAARARAPLSFALRYIEVETSTATTSVSISRHDRSSARRWICDISRAPASRAAARAGLPGGRRRSRRRATPRNTG